MRDNPSDYFKCAHAHYSKVGLREILRKNEFNGRLTLNLT
jgi:hypothetical protein